MQNLQFQMLPYKIPNIDAAEIYEQNPYFRKPYIFSLRAILILYVRIYEE